MHHRALILLATCLLGCMHRGTTRSASWHDVHIHKDRSILVDTTPATLETLPAVMESMGVDKSEYYRIRVEGTTDPAFVEQVTRILQEAGYVKFKAQLK